MKHTLNLAAAALLFGAIQSYGQSVTFDFEDGTSQGWANAGFSGTPLATNVNIGGSLRMFLPLGGFQVGNVSTGNSGSPLYQAMAAALNSPAGYNLSYDYYIDTSAFSGATFLQIGSFVNAGSGYYQQDFGAVKEVELNGTQLASGQVFQGHVSVNFSVFPADASAATETFFRLGLIENGNGTGTGVYFDNISVGSVPEPAALSLLGLAVPAFWMMRRRYSIR